MTSTQGHWDHAALTWPMTTEMTDQPIRAEGGSLKVTGAPAVSSRGNTAGSGALCVWKLDFLNASNFDHTLAMIRNNIWSWFKANMSSLKSQSEEE